MTTSKHKFSCYLSDAGERDLEALYDEIRTAAPLVQRGAISRSTLTERAISLVLEDWRKNGRDAAIFKTLVALPSTGHSDD